MTWKVLVTRHLPPVTSSFMALLISALTTANQILTAVIVITAFSLLLYALTFNLRERVARAFAALLAFVTVVYFCDAVVSTVRSAAQAELWLRAQWLGIAFIPVAYLHFSDALLAAAGQPSRGRRRASIRILYFTGIAFLVAALFTDILVWDGLQESKAWHLRAGPLFPVFMVYFAGSLSWAAWNFQRAYRRCQTSTTRRRMIYLMTSAAAPALGTFPFLLLAGRTASLRPLTFWLLALTTNVVVWALLIVMAYAVAYFGVTPPDRIVKARFFQWLLRGPLVASAVLAVYVFVNRYGPQLGLADTRVLPFLLIGVLLLLQFFITLVRLPIERALFYGADRGELRRLQILEERLLTSGDLRQFLESVLAGVCDVLRSSAAFIAAFDDQGKIEYEVSLGLDTPLPSSAELPALTMRRAVLAKTDPANGSAHPDDFLTSVFEWGGYWIVPLKSHSSGEPLGLLGVRAPPQARPEAAAPANGQANGAALTSDEAALFSLLAGRAASALEDRRLQREVFGALDRLLPQIEVIQRLRASAHYTGAQTLTAAESALAIPDLAQIVKDALSHYWGGPKLTNSPLMGLRVVRRALKEHDGNPVNALRAVLAQAIERVKPEGQRKFTTEWILYNILEMKFLQNRRVREVAMRLAVSEADLYRKQRVAVEEVARIIVAMEKEAAERAMDYDVAG
ncbi:MAG: histidine kinase N-terminal 7TM domain-containing protein [Anaerolineales bacterium]